MKSLNVYVNEKLNGLLINDEAYEFRYEREAKDALSLTMPVRQKSYQTKNIPPIFEMNLPEGVLKDKIKQHFGKVTEVDDMGLLSLVGPYLLGRIKVGLIVKSDVKDIKLDSLLNPEENYFESMMDMYAIHSGVSGVQPKLLVEAKDVRTLKLEHYIVKSWTNEYPELALNEYFCMKACKRANLKTPEFFLSNDRKMFIMKRFDVDENGCYLGFEDMCVLLAKQTEEKYNASYEEIAKVFRALTDVKKVMKDFFKALVMNHLLRNGDGHLKNYGILYTNSSEMSTIKMAPIYDVVTTTVYLPKDIPALKLSGGKLWWKKKTYVSFGLFTCKLSKKEVENIFLECEKAIDVTKIEVQKYSSEYPETKDFLDKLIACWQNIII